MAAKKICFFVTPTRVPILPGREMRPLTTVLMDTFGDIRLNPPIMLDIRPITNPEIPELKPFLSLRQPENHKGKGVFVCHGEKNVARLLKSKFQVLSMICSEEWLEKFRPLLDMRSETVRIYVADKKRLKELIGFKMYHLVMAVGKVPSPATLETILMTCSRPYFFAAVDGLSNADNMGAIIRNCGAFGVQALIVDGSSCSPFMRRSVRATMGAIFDLPIVETADLVQALRQLKIHKVHRFATCLHDSPLRIDHADFTQDCCIVLGSEGHGISGAVLSECDDSIKVPMNGGLDSMNVASAAGVFFYEVAKQRGFKFHT